MLFLIIPKQQPICPANCGRGHQKDVKKILLTLYVAVLVVMAAATLVENATSTPYVQQHIYGTWWFCVLWALLAAGGVAVIIRRKVRRWNVLLLHLALLVILAGALLTHLTSYKGVVHLRGDQPTNKYAEMTAMTTGDVHELPFYVRLDKFSQLNHAGTKAAADYVTRFTIIDGNSKYRCVVSMNNIATFRGVRFYQASFDSDHLGSYLQVNSDRYGIPVTYAGYAMLFFSLLWLLIDPKGTFRRLARRLKALPGFGLALLLTLAAFSYNAGAAAQPAVPKQTAERFGHLLMRYNERICPVETFALDFTQKINGHRTYHGLTANQVLMSWIFFPKEWSNEPFIKIKSKAVRQRFGLPEYASLDAFFNGGTYILGSAASAYAEGQTDAYHKACADIDGKLQIIMSLRQGTPLTLFPHTYADGTTQWYSPFEKYPKRLPQTEVVFIKNFFPFVYGSMAGGDYATADTLLSKLAAYQVRQGGSSVPSPLRVKAEHVYNACPLASILFMANLTLGLIGIVMACVRLRRNTALRATQPSGRGQMMWFVGLDGMLLLSFLALTLLLALRWIITGVIPMGNGYETTLVVAWMTQLCGLLMIAATRRPCALFTSFALLLSGFFLLVSHLSMMDPAMGQLVPVLNSPLLSVHVSFMMMSYALLALTFVCAIMGLASPRMRSGMQVLSAFMLYPAVATLGIGMFLGAIWANVSWGTYWSWDSKETWALITFLVYALPLHGGLYKRFRRPVFYHVYMLLAFLTLLMTYFGVNYFLTGMHSYA